MVLFNILRELLVVCGGILMVRQIQDALGAEKERIQVKRVKPRRIAWLKDHLAIDGVQALKLPGAVVAVARLLVNVLRLQKPDLLVVLRLWVVHDPLHPQLPLHPVRPDTPVLSGVEAFSRDALPHGAGFSGGQR